MRWLGHVFLALLVAGCGGSGGGAMSTATDTESQTPHGQPTDSDTQTPTSQTDSSSMQTTDSETLSFGDTGTLATTTASETATETSSPSETTPETLTQDDTQPLEETASQTASHTEVDTVTAIASDTGFDSVTMAQSETSEDTSSHSDSLTDPGESTQSSTESEPDTHSQSDTNTDIEVDTDVGLLQCVRFVAHDAPIETADGLGWSTAFPTLQPAIDSAWAAVEANCPGGAQVWVKQGTYYICGDGLDDGDRTNSVELRDRVGVLGGFAGIETHQSMRDIAANETVLDGHASMASEAQAYHVVTCLFGEGCGFDAVLDGFTITGGNADGSGDSRSHRGGGLYISGEVNGTRDIGPVVRNCLFRNNAAKFGGAIASIHSFPALSDSVFQNNSATDYGGAIFGSFVNAQEPIPIERCVFEANWVDAPLGAPAGGAIWFDGMGKVRVSHSLFSGNYAKREAGAISVYTFTHLTLENCIFLGNSAQDGAAMHIRLGATAQFVPSVDIRGCTFYGNLGTNYGAIANFGEKVTISSSILWDNEPADITSRGLHAATGIIASHEITYSDTSDAHVGEGNIHSPPLFVNTNPLQGELDLHLQPGSACIDAGEGGPNGLVDDYDLNPRVDDPATPNCAEEPPNPASCDWIADMGAYEFQP